MVCRLEERAAGGQGLAELAVLAAVEHPGLARLIDFGPLPGGGHFVTRSWIEGELLSRWARGRSERELGEVLVHICSALDHLHGLGFVHADLKPSNVLVKVTGEPVVSDFGLSRELGSDPVARGVAGSLFYLAPEVLLGSPAEPRSDLFALGVLMHELFVGRRPAVDEFYARFPRQSFFSACGTSSAELPGWCQDVVEELLERDPARRPSSAAQVGWRLAARLGLQAAAELPRGALRWSPGRGREEWIDAWLARCPGTGEGDSPEWLQVPAGEDPRGLFDALRLAAARRGEALVAVDLGELAGAASDPAALDAGIEARLAEQPGRPVVALLPRRDPWIDCSAAWLLRAARQHGVASAGTAPRLTVVAAGPPVDVGFAVDRAELEPVGPAAIQEFLQQAVHEPDPRRLADLAAALAAASGGSATALDHLLQGLVERGTLLLEDGRPRLRSGPIPAPGVLAELAAPRATPPEDPDARRVLGALWIAGGRLGLDELAELAELSPAALALSLIHI